MLSTNKQPVEISLPLWDSKIIELRVHATKFI